MRVDKTEARLKALLKQGANKRCINCDSLGPQYVVSSFNVFVCTVCSGVHRQFGHRVKGVSMSTFKPEEVTVLEESGNAKFAAHFLHKWSSAALPKPVDRDIRRIHTWIAAVYQERRFFAEPPGGWTPSSGGGSASSASEGREPPVRAMSDVLGSDTPKLKVQGSGGLERTVSAAGSSAGGAATPTRPPPPPPAAAAAGGATAAGGLSLLDASPPKGGSTKTAPAAATAAWDPFGPGSPAAAAKAAPVQPSPPPAAAPAAEAAWASFGDAPAPAAAPAAGPAAAAAAAAAQVPSGQAPAAEGGSGWEAFGDGPTSPKAAAPEGSAAAPAAAAAASSPAKAAPPPKQPVLSSSRREVPMDVFYPEFERIRATGILPTGQPVPLPAFPPSYGAATRPPPGPYAAYSAGHPPAGYAGAYGARPTVAIPPAPLHPPYGYSSASPAAHPSPAYSPSSAYSPAGSGVSPAGSALSAAPPHANGGAYPGHAGVGIATDLRSSAGSLSDLLPGSAAPTPGPQRPSGPAGDAAADPFAGLAPGLRGALPAAPNGGSARYGAPPPTPAGGPPFHPPPAAYAPSPAYAPFAAPPVPTAGMAPATAAASATLFGGAPSLTGYDMGAPAAPKPQATGNPFA